MTEERRVSFGEVFRVGEFRALWGAQLLSIAGDQLARVALSLLVFDRTGSPALAALTYALTFLPDLIGGPLLAGIADRYPRRGVMVVTDVARLALVGLMAVPGMPFVVLAALLVFVQLLASPFNAARAAVLPSVLDGDRFVVGQAIINITYQVAQLGGYVIGGALVAFTGPNVALAIDAGTFGLSALLIRFGMRDRPVPESVEAAPATRTFGALRVGARLVWHDRVLRALVVLACVSGFYVVAEGLSVPYAAQLGGGPIAAGLLFAAHPAGTVVGMLVLTRLVDPPDRLRLLGPLAVAACALLVVCALAPGLTITLLIWALAGAASAYQTIASAEFVRAVPDAGRGQAFGLASTSMRVAQGLGVVLAGAAAEWYAPSTVVAVSGLLGTLAAALAAVGWQRARRSGVTAQG